MLAVLLTGCYSNANEIEVVTNDMYEELDSALEMHTNDTLLAAVEATLQVADVALDEILEDKIKTRNQIQQLQNTINTEANILTNLSGELGSKDSLLYVYRENNLILEEKVHDIETQLIDALHTCNTECFPTITELSEKNIQLTKYIDSLQSQVNLLDSLVMSNKRLRNKLMETKNGTER